jgi:hypothetical protein
VGQSDVRLTHRMEGVLYYAKFNGVPQGGESTTMISFTKDLDNWDRIIQSLQIWVRIALQAEFFPSSPMLVHGIDPFAGNNRPDSLIKNANISAECVWFDSWQRRQGRVYGNT